MTDPSTDSDATPVTVGSTEPGGEATESNRPPAGSGSDTGRRYPPPAEALIDQEQKGGQEPPAEMLMDSVEFSAPNRPDTVQLNERDASQ